MYWGGGGEWYEFSVNSHEKPWRPEGNGMTFKTSKNTVNQGSFYSKQKYPSKNGKIKTFSNKSSF